MRIYNSKTHKKEEFTPLVPGKVTMYVCGPTVYDQIHIGNGRTFVSFDMCRRYLIYKGYEVTFAQNLTDVDDKIIQRAQEQGKEASEIAATFSEAFIEQMKRLGVLAPDIRPQATREIDAMIEMIEGLIKKNHAYVAPSGDVYFSVRSVETYGNVSGRNVDELLVGARIEENTDKRDPLDFALWKAAKPGEPSWESPWGEGRPGWHTECSAMVHKYLGTPIDIHGGGSDLIFPHHENEAAQASACWDTALANIWMHTGMLRVEGEKMSKSLGNFYTVKEVLDKYPPSALRLLMAQTHYRSPMDFSFERLRGAAAALEKLQTTIQNLRWFASQDTNSADKPLISVVHEDGDNRLEKARKDFEAAMDDDFNTAAALAAIFEVQTDLNKWLEDAHAEDPAAREYACVAADTLEELLSILGIESARDSDGDTEAENLTALQEILARHGGPCDANTIPELLKALASLRDEARANKDYATSDALRDELIAAGYTVEDTPSGTRIK